MLEEVAEGAGRISRRLLVGGALGLVALAPLAASAQEQRVAANGTAPQNVSVSAECAPIRDIAQQTACEVQRRRDAELAKIRATTQAANDRGDCADQLRQLREADPTVVERGKRILGNTPLKTFGTCNLVKALTNS